MSITFKVRMFYSSGQVPHLAPSSNRHLLRHTFELVNYVYKILHYSLVVTNAVSHAVSYVLKNSINKAARSSQYHKILCICI